MATVQALLDLLEDDIASVQDTINALRLAHVVAQPVPVVGGGATDPRLLTVYAVLTKNAEGKEVVATVNGLPLLVPTRGDAAQTLTQVQQEVQGHASLVGKVLTIVRYTHREDLATLDRRHEQRPGRKVKSPFG